MGQRYIRRQNEIDFIRRYDKDNKDRALSQVEADELSKLINYIRSTMHDHACLEVWELLFDRTLPNWRTCVLGKNFSVREIRRRKWERPLIEYFFQN